MLALRITYGWLTTVVPQIFGDGWESWFDNPSEYEILNLRMNRSGLVHYGRVINDRLFKEVRLDRVYESLFDLGSFDDTFTTFGGRAT